MKKALSWTFGLSILYSIFLFFAKKYWIDPKGISNFLFLLLIVIYMWIPGTIAIIFSKKEKISLPVFKKPNKYLWSAIFIPVFISLLTFALSFLFAKFKPMAPDTFQPLFSILPFPSLWMKYVFLSFTVIVSGILIGGTVNLFSTLGEEIMWRGYLFEKFKHMGFWKSSLIIGFIWGLWHVPLIILIGLNYPKNPILGSFWMIAGTILLAPILQYLRIKGKSILIPAIFHGILNKVTPLCMIFFVEGSYLLIGPVGIAGFLALILVNLMFYKSYKKQVLSYG